MYRCFWNSVFGFCCKDQQEHWAAGYEAPMLGSIVHRGRNNLAVWSDYPTVFVCWFLLKCRSRFDPFINKLDVGIFQFPSWGH